MRKLLLVLALLAAAALGFRIADDRPTAWPRQSPTEAGLRPAALADLARYVGGHGVVVRGLSVVHEWGDPALVGNVASAAKPVYAHLLLVALDEGRLDSLDDPVATFERELAALGGDDEAASITWSHLAQQTSGYGVREEPGEAFAYNDFQAALLFDALVLGVFESSYEDMDAEILDPWLARPLECEDEPTLMISRDVPGRLGISARDFARFGVLYRDGGRWAGRQVIPESFVRRATESALSPSFPETSNETDSMLPGQRSLGELRKRHFYSHDGSTSFYWWTNPDRRKWPDAPSDTFAALGWSGRVALVVVPSLDLVASWHGSFSGSERGVDIVNEALRRLVDAAPGSAAPGGPERTPAGRP